MPGNQTITYGQHATVPAQTPMATGKGFTGWYTTSGCTTAFNFAGTPITSDTTVYAGWSATLTVTFSANGQTADNMPPSQTITYNGYATAPTEVPTANGKLFKGWYTTGECTTAFNFTGTRITAATTIYAKWVAAYTVTYHIPQAVPNMFDVPNMQPGWVTNVDGIWIVPDANESFNASAMSSYWRNYVGFNDRTWDSTPYASTAPYEYYKGLGAWRLADGQTHASAHAWSSDNSAYIKPDNGKVANANNRYFTVRFEAGQRPTQFDIFFYEVYPQNLNVNPDYPSWWMFVDPFHSKRWKQGSSAGPEFDFNTTPIPAEGVHLYLDLDMSRWDHYDNPYVGP
jgi:hypothetical protein